MQRPLPPFRAKPSRRPRTPKRFSEAGRSTAAAAISVKARRRPIRFARPHAPPSLKILSRTGEARA